MGFNSVFKGLNGTVRIQCYCFVLSVRMNFKDDIKFLIEKVRYLKEFLIFFTSLFLTQIEPFSSIIHSS